jgi:hypothetical protein
MRELLDQKLAFSYGVPQGQFTAAYAFLNQMTKDATRYVQQLETPRK